MSDKPAAAAQDISALTDNAVAAAGLLYLAILGLDGIRCDEWMVGALIHGASNALNRTEAARAEATGELSRIGVEA